MAAPSVATPLLKEGARSPPAPAKTQREAGLDTARPPLHQSQARHRLGENGRRGRETRESRDRETTSDERYC